MKYYKLSYDYENDYDYVNCNVGVIRDIIENNSLTGFAFIEVEVY